MLEYARRSLVLRTQTSPGRSELQTMERTFGCSTVPEERLSADRIPSGLPPPKIGNLRLNGSLRESRSAEDLDLRVDMVLQGDERMAIGRELNLTATIQVSSEEELSGS